MPYQIPDLTDEQKTLILASYADMDLRALTRLVFKNDSLDGRSNEAKAIKAFLAGVGKTVETTTKEEKRPAIVLTDEQKAKIDQAACDIRDGSLNQIELARLVFGDATIQNLSREWRAVHAYLKEFYPDGINVSEEPVEVKIYEPPTTITRLVGVVNDYVPTGDGGRTYDWNKLKASEKRQLTALMSYMRQYLFKHWASQYDRVVDRELYLSTFIRWCHDKPDLTPIEVDQMVLAAVETVNITQIARQIQRIDKMQDEIYNGEILDANGKRVRLTQNDVEMINNIRTKYDAAKSRLEKLMGMLEETRSKRIEARDKRNATFIDLTNQWADDEEWRQNMVKLGQKEKEEDMEAVNKLADLSDLEALITGQTKEEAGRG